MSNKEPRNILDRILAACLVLFASALALYGAVQLVRAVWVWLLVGLVVAAVVAAGVFVLRRRYGGW